MRSVWILAVFLHLIIKTVSPVNNTTCDSKKEIDCGVGSTLRCIPVEWQCDNIKDCDNGNDESGCIYGSKCLNDFMICKNTHCIASHYKCDGNDDCGDGSDEKHCDYNNITASSSEECESPKMKCETGECIPKERICDGVFDCPTEEDEMNCTSSMEEEFLPGYSLCSDQKHYVSNVVLCDGERDCLDGSDEVNCEIHKTKYSCNSSDTFLCKSKGIEQKVCIPQNATCNGITQCPLGDDEDNCEDLKGCAVQEHKCHHFCEDRPESFVCGCAEGYKLDSDGRLCIYESEASSAGYLLTASEDKVHKIPLADFNNETEKPIMHQFEHGIVKSIDYMRQNDQIFMMVIDLHLPSNRGELAVLRDGQMKTLRENITAHDSIAVDWIGENVFFTQSFMSSSPGIHVCTMNGLFCRQIIKGRSIGLMYHGLVVHPTRGIIVWIEFLYPGHLQHIMMANMDGSDVRFLMKMSNSRRSPSAITIDQVKSDVYYADSKGIERINIDTKERHVVFSHKYYAHTTDMVYLNGFLYWIQPGQNSMNLMARDVEHNHSTSHVVHKFESQQFGIALNHSLHQIEPSSNPCHELDCPWLCIIIPKSSSGGITAKCICPDGYTPSGDTCIPFSPFDEMEILRNYSHIGFELMSEYCKRGIGCKNGGSCRQIFNQSRIVCDCKLPFDGQYCERTNPEIHAALKEFKTQFGAFAVLSICILVLLIVGCGALVKFVKRKLSSRGLIDDMATTPLVEKLRKIVGKERKTSVNGEGIRMENLPTSFNNPSFDEESNVSSAFSTSSSASFSTTIRFENDGSLL